MVLPTTEDGDVLEMYKKLEWGEASSCLDTLVL